MWGYLVPIDSKSGDAMVLKRRSACPVPTTMLGATSGKQRVGKKTYQEQEWEYEKQKQLKGISAGGYLIGRHPECGECSQAFPQTGTCASWTQR